MAADGAAEDVALPELHVRLLVDARSGNTLFYYIVGDNGSSAEGGPEGTYNETMALHGVIGRPEHASRRHMGRLGDIPVWCAPSHRPGRVAQHPADTASSTGS